MQNGVGVIPRKEAKENVTNISYVQCVYYHFSYLENVWKYL